MFISKVRTVSLTDFNFPNLPVTPFNNTNLMFVGRQSGLLTLHFALRTVCNMQLLTDHEADNGFFFTVYTCTAHRTSGSSPQIISIQLLLATTLQHPVLGAHTQPVCELPDSLIINSVYLPMFYTQGSVTSPFWHRLKGLAWELCLPQEGKNTLDKSKDYFVNETVPFSDVKYWHLIQSAQLFVEWWMCSMRKTIWSVRLSTHIQSVSVGLAVGAVEQQGTDSAFDSCLGKEQSFRKPRRHFQIIGVSIHLWLSLFPKSLTHGPTIKGA